MKVCFACSTSEIGTHKDAYRRICALIEEMGHTLTRNWIEEAIQVVDGRTIGTLDREDVYSKVLGSILAADVMIVEGTVASFSVGHQVTLALSKNKPILFLIKKSPARKSGGAKNSFLAGITSPLLTIAEYDDSNLADILNEFLNNNGGKPIVKFNIVLTKEIENYLNWANFTYKINKSEFIRNLILKHMRDDDKQYQKYSNPTSL